MHHARKHRKYWALGRYHVTAPMSLTVSHSIVLSQANYYLLRASMSMFCPVCKQLKHEHVLGRACSCRNRICKPCLEKWWRTCREKNRRFTCPFDRKEISERAIKRLRLARLPERTERDEGETPTRPSFALSAQRLSDALSSPELIEVQAAALRDASRLRRDQQVEAPHDAS